MRVEGSNRGLADLRSAVTRPIALLTRFDHSESRRFSIGERKIERDNCSDADLAGTGRDSRRALGNGYAPHRRRGWHDRGREGRRETEELLKEATRNPQTSHRSTSFLIRSTYGMYPVAERSPSQRGTRG